MAHTYKAHGHRNALHLRVDSTVCVCCLKEFWERERLLHHVWYRSKRCLSYYMSLPAGDAEEFKECHDLQTATLRSKRHKGEYRLSGRPPVRVPGPLPDIAFACSR